MSKVITINMCEVGLAVKDSCLYLTTIKGKSLLTPYKLLQNQKIEILSDGNLYANDEIVNISSIITNDTENKWTISIGGVTFIITYFDDTIGMLVYVKDYMFHPYVTIDLA